MAISFRKRVKGLRVGMPQAPFKNGGSLQLTTTAPLMDKKLHRVGLKNIKKHELKSIKKWFIHRIL